MEEAVKQYNTDLDALKNFKTVTDEINIVDNSIKKKVNRNYQHLEYLSNLLSSATNSFYNIMINLDTI